MGKLYLGTQNIGHLVVTGTAPEPKPLYLVKVIDYDGTILKSENLAEGDTFTLPTPPTHTELTFISWSSPVEIVGDSVVVGNFGFTIGATYTTASGNTEIYRARTLLSEVYLYGGGFAVTITWADGTTDISTTRGNITFTHTYSEVTSGVESISGTDYQLGYASGTGNMFGRSSNVTKVFIAKGVRLSQRAFYQCRSLESVVMSKGSSTSLSCFEDCASLTSITLPQGDIGISEKSFLGCRNLTNVVIPQSVTSIGDYVFAACSLLTSVVIPQSVTSIGSGAFQSCTALSSLTIGQSVTSIGSGAFQYCYSLKSVEIPDSVTSIGSLAFLSCTALSSLTIGQSVTSIGSGAFQSCAALSSLTIGQSVTSIGSRAFQYCYSLKSVEIPQSVTSISNTAFASCYAIIKYDFSQSATIPTLVSTDVFNGINISCRIEVPQALYDTWIATTNWSYYANYIYGV